MLFLFATYFLGLATNNAQQLTERIVDAAPQKSIPFVTVRVTEVDFNKDGYFTFSSKTTMLL